MYHKQLERQINKYLGDSYDKQGPLDKLLQAISQSYSNYERDKELSEHAFSVNELEYQKVNNNLKKFTQNLEGIVKERTKELTEVAQFPIENPNPIFRVADDGTILFLNPAAAEQIKTIEYNSVQFSPKEFFLSYIKQTKQKGTFDIKSNDKAYLFYYKKIPGKPYYNFYGADVTEKNELQLHFQDNLLRLRNFLENTEDAYYLIYQNHPEKNYVTSKWESFYGFSHENCKDIFKKRSKLVISESAKEHEQRIKNIQPGSHISIRYQVKNNSNNRTYWLSESITKQYDLVLEDYIISGRITDVTIEQEYAMQLKESEERFRTIMDKVPVMVWVSDEKNLVTYSNRALIDFIGFDLADIKNHREYIKFIHPADRKIAVTEWQKSIKKRKVIQSEYRLKNSKGEYHNILEQAVPRFYANGAFAGYIGAYFDFTSEKKLQAQLAIRKEKLEFLIRNSPDVVVLTNHKGDIEYVSPNIKKILGYQPSEILQHNINDIICKNCLHQMTPLWMNGINKKNTKLNYFLVHKNGKTIWVESAISLIKGTSKEEQKFLLHHRDITSMKNAQDALKESEQKYRGLFENMNLGVMEVDLNGNIVWINEAFKINFGYTIKTLKGKNAIKTFIPQNFNRLDLKQIQEQRKQKKDSMYEVKMQNKKGELLDVVISGSPIIDINGNTKGSIGIHWNVTEIRKMEQQIEEEKIRHQKDIMKATLNTEERQREIFGNELHDGVGHILTYTSLYLQLGANEKSIDNNYILKAKQKVDDALNEVRRISRSMIPPALLDLGLKEAIIELFNQYNQVQQMNFQVTCKQNSFNGINIEVQKNIYRIVQELINNTIKHAHSTKTIFECNRTQKELVIRYSDNGVGFDPEKVKRSVGLQSINNRVYFYGGDIKMSTSKNKGTHYTIHFQLKNIITEQ